MFFFLMWSHQSQVAALVPDNTLDCFCPKQTIFNQNKNNLLVHTEPVSPPSDDGSPLSLVHRSGKFCSIVVTIRFSIDLLPAELDPKKWEGSH